MMLVFTSVCIFSGTMVAIRILNRNARSTGSQNRIDIRCFKLGLDVKHQYFSMAQTEMTASATVSLAVSTGAVRRRSSPCLQLQYVAASAWPHVCPQ